MSASSAGAAGGLQAGRVLRRWEWEGTGDLSSRLVRCQSETCYLARARLPRGLPHSHAVVLVDFVKGDRRLESRCLRLHGGAERSDELLGWITTPAGATHLRVHLPGEGVATALRELVLRGVSALDPICHPLANVPSWDTYRPPMPISRVLLPRELEPLTGHLPGLPVELIGRPRSRAQLRRLTAAGACVLAPGWIERLGLSLAEVEDLAQAGWVLVDLGTLARLIGAAGGTGIGVTTHSSPDGIMSARVEYADVPTRGLALQDVVPYATIDARGRFVVRALRNSRSWRRHAAAAGWVTLLSLETPWEQERRDGLSVMRTVGGGRLLATDLPWLVVGACGRLLAPRLAAHLLRMHLGAPLPDHVQYWNRWAAPDELVRDIADMPNRYPRLRTMRWASADPTMAHLGISLPNEHAEHHLLLRTGRIDEAGLHAGLPAQPMMIFMKWLAGQMERATPWAQRHLSRCRVTWQFDTATGLKYAAGFDAADDPPRPTPQVVRLRLADGPAARPAGPDVVTLPPDEGPHGDGSLDWLDGLVRHVLPLIEGRRVELEKRFASAAR